MREPRQVAGRRRHADADEADVLVAQRARRRDRHHLVGTAARGMRTIRSTLIALLLLGEPDAQDHAHIVSELPMAGDVVADCLRLIVRLYVAIVIANALMVPVLGAMTAAQWEPHDRGAKVAALSAVAIYALWRFVKFRMEPISRPTHCRRPTSPATPRTRSRSRPRGCAP